jgi:hypothetical protein
MPERPAPPPWGALIMTALAREGLSVREAARRAGLSEGRWRQITAGYQIVSPGVYAEVHGPAATIARMAWVVGVTAEQLSDVGRDDAAQLLAAHSRSDIDEIMARVRELNADQARELLARIASQLGITLPPVAGSNDE